MTRVATTRAPRHVFGQYTVSTINQKENMSHFTEIKTQIKDIETQRLPCQDRVRLKFNLAA
jgi:hypothetical protein